MSFETESQNRLVSGLVDFHVHVGERIAGYQLRDDFSALNNIPALAAIGAFVTEEASDPLRIKLQRMREDAAQHFHGHVHWHLTPVQSQAEELIPLLAEDTDLKFYTTYKAAGLYRSYAEIERWMQDLKDLKPRMLIHCEDDEIIASNSAKHPFRHPFDHSKRRLEYAEIKAVGHILELAIKNEYPVHIVHVSSPGSAILIREAKEDYPFITCETAPHYLIYNEERLQAADAHRWICSPPYRSENSRGMLVELLQDGVFDIIASDHCAFSDADKDRFKNTPEQVPCGIAGIATLFSSLYDALVLGGKISLDELLRLSMYNPALLMAFTPLQRYPLSELLRSSAQGDEIEGQEALDKSNNKI